MNDYLVVRDAQTMGPIYERLGIRVATVVDGGFKKVILDLGGVPWINSTGLGILISGYTTLKKSGGELKLLKVSDRIENIFIVSKLYTVFESYQDEDEAIRSFA